MLGNSKTGQVSGLLIRNWVPTFVDRFLSDNNEGSAGLEFGIKTLMRSNPNILRVVVNSGVSVKRIPRLCRNFSDFDVREVHLPRWFVLDFLVMTPNSPDPAAVTFVQVAAADGGSARQQVFINRNMIKSSDKLPEKEFWEEMRFALSKLGLEEFWSKVSGIIKPSWGVLEKGRYGTLYISEQDFHFCYLPHDISVLPDGIDQFDLTRLEVLLEDTGLQSKEFIKPNATRDYIIRTVSHLGDTGGHNILAGADEREEREAYESRKL